MEWLGILAAILPHGRVAHMPHANIPAQPLHVLLCKDLGHHAVGLAQVGPSQRVRDYGGPELMRFSEVANIYRQVRKRLPRKVPLPSVGVIAEALNGIHVTKTGDRGTETFRTWPTNL